MTADYKCSQRDKEMVGLETSLGGARRAAVSGRCGHAEETHPDAHSVSPIPVSTPE